MENWFFFSHLFVWLFLSHWFVNGNYLIIIVSACVILPLALMKQLGMFFILPSHFLLKENFSYSCRCHVMLTSCCLLLFWNERMTNPSLLNLFSFKSFCHILLSLSAPGYLGYTSGFSLSCMMFFLISVSQWRHTKCDRLFPWSNIYLWLTKWAQLHRSYTRNSPPCVRSMTWSMWIRMRLIPSTPKLEMRQTCARPSFSPSTHRLEGNLCSHTFP